MKILTRLFGGNIKITANSLILTIKRNYRPFLGPPSKKLSTFLKLKKSVASILNHLKSYPSFTNCGDMDVLSIIKVFEKLVPSTLAEKWDNTGLLIEPSNKTNISTIFFTNDLTEPVLNEAISIKSDLIISYHPPIFSSLKSLTQSNWKDRILMKCIANCIAVYSPHTCCDAVSGGVNDWLISCFTLSACHPIVQSYEVDSPYSHVITIDAALDDDVLNSLQSLVDCKISQSKSNLGSMFRVKVNKSCLNTVMNFLTEKVPRFSTYVMPTSPLPHLSCGMGRIGTLTKPLLLSECIKLIKIHMNLNYIRFSQSVAHFSDTIISTVAVCAGSGASILKGVHADLYITGEMSHHDLLDASHRKVSVLLCEHSNSERGYLTTLVESLRPMLPGIKLAISSIDRDPITIV